MTGRIYKNQIEFQDLVTKGELRLPEDSTKWFSYHVQAMVEELGEVLKADKRWKTHRNECFDPENKAEELADVFITAMNLSIFSGITFDQMESAILNKQIENMQKLSKARQEAQGC